TVQVDAIGSEHLLLPVVGHAVAELADDDVGQHAWREDATPQQRPGQRCRLDGHLVPLGVGVKRGVRVGLSVEDLVLGSRNDDAHWAWLLTAELVAFLPANALGLTLQLGVGKLDALLGHVSGCEVASSFGFGALLPRWLAR